MLRHATRGLRHTGLARPHPVVVRCLNKRAVLPQPPSSVPGPSKSSAFLNATSQSNPKNTARFQKPRPQVLPRDEPSDVPDFITYDDDAGVLATSLEQEDVLTAKEQWDALSSSGALETLIQLHGRALSNLVKHISAASLVRLKNAGELHALEDMALVLASSGFPAGLRGLMIEYLNRHEPDDVHRLYARFKDLSGRAPSWKDALGTEPAGVEDQALNPHPHPSLPQDYLPAPLHQPEGDPVLMFNPILSEMLMFAVAASAIRGGFREALQLTLQAKCHLSKATLRLVVDSIGPNNTFAQRMEQFLLRALTMNVLSRPSAFHRHISNLTQDHSVLALQNVYTGIIEGLSGPDPYLTLDLKCVCGRTPIHVPDNVWPMFLTSFVQSQKMDLAEQLWDDAARLGVALNIRLWNALLDGYAHLRMADRLIATWNLMRQEGLTIETSSYRAVIHGLFNSDRTAEALSYFSAFQHDLKRKAFPPDAGARIVYNCVIRWLLVRHQANKAAEVLSDMETAGISADIYTINAFLRFYARESNLTGVADQLQKMDGLHITPDSHTYSILLTALLSVRKDAMTVVFDLMNQYGTKPNVAMYTTIIDALMAEQTPVAFQAAMDLLQEMETSKSEVLRPNGVTYTSILCGIHKRNWLDQRTAREYTELIAEKMTRQRLLHTVISYNILIKACLENPEPDGMQAALEYYREMKRRKIAPTRDTWYILLVGMDKRREWTVANTLIDEMYATKSGALPNTLANLVAKVRGRIERAANKSRIFQ